MECTCARPAHEPTPVEAYWHAVHEIVEWADGQTFLVVQPPLPFIELPDPVGLSAAA